MSALVFSIAIPALGQSEFLPTALASIRAQSPPVELAVLDASSDDRVQAVLAQHTISLAYSYHHPDGGQAAAIQEGWNHTTGDVVAWLCADDYFFPDALASVAEAFRRNPETDVVFGHAVHVSVTGAFEGYFPSINANPQALRRGCSICQPACFVRRRAMARVGGLTPNLHYIMDWDLWLRLYDAGCRFTFLDQPLAAVRTYRETKTRTGGRRRRDEIAAFLRARHHGWITRWRSMLGFLRLDLRHADSQGIIRHALDFGAGFNRRVFGPARPVIRGLECRTNRVSGECEASVPWYANEPARQAIVVTDQPVPLELMINGERVALAPIGPHDAIAVGRTVSGHGYRAAFDAGPGNVLSFKLRSTARTWRLLGVDVR